MTVARYTEGQFAVGIVDVAERFVQINGVWTEVFFQALSANLRFNHGLVVVRRYFNFHARRFRNTAGGHRVREEVRAVVIGIRCVGDGAVSVHHNAAVRRTIARFHRDNRIVALERIVSQYINLNAGVFFGFQVVFLDVGNGGHVKHHVLTD
ncbi:hypothetical protein Vpro01_04461 [Vibrio proteolyticus]